jgi:heat shock protein HslJ
MKNKISIFFLVMSVFVSACSVKEKTTSVELNDTHWVLEQINGQPVIDDTLPTLSFRGDQEVEGNASCNAFFGTYLSEDNTLTITGLGYTEMGCVGVMEQETAYLAALESAKTYRNEDGKLLLIDAAGNTVLVFSPKDMSLEGVFWDLTRYNICFA